MPRRRETGLTLLELAIVLAVLASLVGLVLPTVRGLLDSARLARIVSLADTLTNACKRFHKDTKAYAREDGSSSLGSDHQLAYDPNAADPLNPILPGWQGPYIESPLRNDAVPLEQVTIQLLASSLGLGGAGYALLEGGPLTGSPTEGQELVIANIPVDWAERIDEAIDGEVGPGKGRVAYWVDIATLKAQIYILILRPPL